MAVLRAYSGSVFRDHSWWGTGWGTVNPDSSVLTAAGKSAVLGSARTVAAVSVQDTGHTLHGWGEPAVMKEAWAAKPSAQK